jgi:WD40 repeat protein
MTDPQPVPAPEPPPPPPSDPLPAPDPAPEPVPNPQPAPEPPPAPPGAPAAPVTSGLAPPSGSTAPKPVVLRHMESIAEPGLRDGVWMSATHFAAAGEAGVGIYDLSQAEPRRAPLGIRDDVTALAWVARSRALILGDAGGEVRSNEFSGRAGWFVNANRDRIVSLVDDPEGRKLLSVSERDVCVIDPDGPEWLLDEQSRAATWLGEGVLATVGPSGVEVWLCETRGKVATVDAPAASVRALEYLAAPQLLAIGLESGEVAFWSLMDDPPVARGAIRQPDGLTAFAVAPDEMTLATGTATGAVRVWRDFAPEAPKPADAGAAVRALRYSPDGTRLAAITADGLVLYAVVEE